MLRTFRVGSPRSSGEGTRIGAVRYLPRGVRKQDYARLDYFDVWLPILAPSRELLRWFKDGDLADAGHRRRFFRRYEREMMQRTDSRQVICLLAKMSSRAPMSIGCYCEDESRCHRSVLLPLIEREAALVHQADG